MLIRPWLCGGHQVTIKGFFKDYTAFASKKIIDYMKLQ
jgi:hypothetical protein